MVALDLVIYGQHVAFHKIPALWRLHRMHHTDLDIDASTGLRFHPLEMALSLGLKLAAVVALGAAPLAAVLFEVILNAVTLFNHGNMRLGKGLDRAIRALIVTPDMHRIHHSALRAETDSNYGFNLSCWDRLFGTYCAMPSKGYDGMTIGLEEFRDPKWLGIAWMLVTPFHRTRRRPSRAKGSAMKTLLLLRHAKAEAHSGPSGDHARGLTARGQKASGDMGTYLTRHGPLPELIICSDARRATETLDGVLVALAGHPRVEVEPRIYLAEPDTILRRLRKADDRFGTVMIIGHNPGLEDLTRDLVAQPAQGAGAKAYERMSAKFPTAGLAEIVFDLESWALADYGAGRLEAFVVPRDLAEG